MTRMLARTRVVDTLVSTDLDQTCPHHTAKSSTYTRHMKIRCPSRLLFIAFFVALPAREVGATCYQLFDEKNKLVIQSAHSPVSLSGSLSENVSRSYPGYYLITSTLAQCPEVDEVARQATTVKLQSETWNRGPIAIEPERVYDGYYVGQSTGATRPLPVARGSSAGSGRAGTDVHVQRYTRKDGSNVPAHTRASPGSGSSRR